MEHIEAFIARWCKGDERAAEMIYNQTYNSAYLLAYGLLGNPADAEEAAQTVHDRVEGEVARVGHAAPLHPQVVAIGETLLQLVAEPRLADACISHQEDHLAVALGRGREGPLQGRELRRATDQGGESGRRARLHALENLALQDVPGGQLRAAGGYLLLGEPDSVYQLRGGDDIVVDHGDDVRVRVVEGERQHASDVLAVPVRTRPVDEEWVVLLEGPEEGTYVVESPPTGLGWWPRLPPRIAGRVAPEKLPGIPGSR